jgi:CRP/FNR family cyclic AMP-dependent transcriptional regulator
MPMSDTLRFAPQDIIFKQAYPGDDAYVILSGEVEIYLEHPDGKEQRLAVLGKGQMFGELAQLDGRPRSASARALKETVLQIVQL